jgi:hypothetical protein
MDNRDLQAKEIKMTPREATKTPVDIEAQKAKMKEKRAEQVSAALEEIEYWEVMNRLQQLKASFYAHKVLELDNIQRLAEKAYQEKTQQNGTTSTDKEDNNQA